MSIARAARAVSVALLAGAAACTQVYLPEAAPAPKPGAENEAKADSTKNKEPFKKWDDVLKDTRAIPGYFTVHLKRDNTLYLELAPEQLGHQFGLGMHISKGVGDFDIQQGLPLSETRLMRFERSGDQVYLVHLNPRFTADSGTPMHVSMEGNVGHSVVDAFKIESEHKDSKHLLIDLTGFVVSDYADLASLLKSYYGNHPVSFDKDRSHVGRAMGFPQNVEIDADLTFKASGAPQFGGAGVSDVRSVPVGVRYSWFALPAQLMRPRLADDRVGHFLDAQEDFSRDRAETPFVRYVNRWRLEKKDDSQALSEPVRPIVYYVDRSVPVAYRAYVKQGIEAWNKAFEAAGFKNAIVARDAPDDSTWSAEDMRYSTVRWTAAYRMGYAIGPSETDPRTGEILNADVLISSEFTRAWLYEYQELASPAAMRQWFERMQEPASKLPPRVAQRMCYAAAGKQYQLGVEYTMLAALGELEGGKPMPESYVGAAIRDLVMHEVGHTLGLRHNFKASSGIPFDRLNDTTYTRDHGLTLSVMDYGAVNVSANRARQGDYWNHTVGTYDVWAMRYAYQPMYQQPSTGPLPMAGTRVATPDAERVGLDKVAAQVADPMHTYATDEDTWLGTFAVDPLSNAWDLGSDPLAFAKERLILVNEVQPELERRLIAPGEGYQRLRGAMAAMFSERFNALLPVTKQIGGLYTARDHKGDPNARLPFTPVPVAKQREAVQMLVAGAFAEDAFQFDPAQLNKLAPNRWLQWGMEPFAVPVDFPVHGYVNAVQDALLYSVLDPFKLQRMVDNEVRVARPQDAYTMGELFETLTGAIWSELGDGRNPRSVNSFRRTLQLSYTNELMGLMLSGSLALPQDARSLARYELKQLTARLAAALGAGTNLDVTTRAHFDEVKALVDEALEARMVRSVR